MIRISMLSQIAVLVAASALAHPVNATPVSGVYSGILHGTDTWGYFGTAGASLTGQIVTGSYSFDTALMSDVSTPGYNIYSVNGTNPNAISLTATILGTTISASSGGNGALVQYGIDPTHIYNNLRAEPGTSDIQVYLISADTFVQGAPINAPFVLETSPSYTSSTGYLSIAPSGGGFQLDNFTFTQIETAAIPEPASIALLGAGLVGMAFRRRKA